MHKFCKYSSKILSLEILSLLFLALFITYFVQKMSEYNLGFFFEFAGFILLITLLPLILFFAPILSTKISKLLSFFEACKDKKNDS